MKLNKRSLLSFVFLMCSAFAFAQIDVFWQNSANNSNFWDSGNPWFYPDPSIRDRPNIDYNSSTKHNVYFGNNTGNSTINVNGQFFGLRSFNIDNGATTARIFQQDINGGIGIENGIFNNSTTPHVFDVQIAIDQNNAILGADAGGLTFMREIFSNGRPFEVRGSQPLLISGFISQNNGSVTKTGTNTVTFSGTNTYTGLTTINAGTLRLNRTGGTTIPTTNNVTISGGNLQVSTNQTLNNLTITSGTLTVDANTTLTVTGAFTGGGTIINNGRIVLAGTAAQNFPGAGSVTAMNELEVNNAANVNLNNSLAITGSLILTTGTLNIAGNLLDLNGASLSRTSGFLNGSNTSDFTVRGNTGGTVTISQSGNISLETVTISGNRVVAMNGINNLALSGALTIASTATFDNGGESQITQNTGGTITIDGTFITRDAEGFSGTNTSIPGIAPTLNTGCTIEYGRVGNQLISIRSDYKNMRFSGGGTKSFESASPISTIVGTVYINDATIVDVSNNAFGNGSTILSMTNGRFRTSGTGTKPDISGGFNLTGGVVEFYNNLVTTQTIRSTAFMYYAIEVTGTNVGNSSGNINLRSNGSFTVKTGGIFIMNDNAIVQGEAGTQTITVETNGKFVCNDVQGFSGIGNLTSVRTDDIETVNLQVGSTIEYGHTSAQVFSARTDYKNVIISGGGAKTLNGASTISGTLTLTNGLVTTTNTNLLTMSNGSSVSGASDLSFVNGPMQKIGNAPFIFPVGKPITSGPVSNGSPTVGGYRPIAISAPSTSTDAFTAEFYLANPNLIGIITASGLVRISSCEYWRLDRTTGTSSVNVTLSWTDKSKCNYGNYISDPASVVVVHNTATGYPFGSGSWDAYGRNGGHTGNAAAGTVTWNGVNTFSPFTIGTTDQTANLLPFNLSSFTALPKQQAVQLDWKVANNNEQQEYMLERSSDGINFKTLTVVAAKPNITTAEYRHTDAQPLSGWNYYRLRAKDYQNKIQASQIIKVWIGKGSFISVLPNPASEKIVINLSEPSSIQQIQIVNTTGQVLRQLNTIQFLHEINISNLQAGMYYIRFLGKDGLTTRTFVKQ